MSNNWTILSDDEEYDVYYDCDENGEMCNTTYNEDEFDYYNYEETIYDIKKYYDIHGIFPPDGHFGDMPYYESHIPQKGKQNSKKPKFND